MKMIKDIKEVFNQEFLMNLLCTASCNSFWFTCSVHEDTPKSVINKAKSLECCEDKWAYCLLHGGSINIYDFEEATDHKLTLKQIIDGFKIVMLNYPKMYAAIMDKTYDLYDADAVIQCAVFGDIIYG